MAQTIRRLTDAKCQAARKPGRLNDGGGLFLNVSKSGSRSWIFVSRKGGRWREMGLGSYPGTGLARARQLAQDAAVAIAEGRDPIAEKKRGSEPSFSECADEYVSRHETGWRNDKHRQQWRNTLRDYCKPIAGKQVSEVDTSDVLRILQPLWMEKNETASRLRGRIERVLNYAKVKGWRTGENPAAWRGNLDNLLPKRQKLQRGHHSAMPYADVPAFMEKVRGSDATAARALEVLILTAARSGEVLNARWSEIDLDKGLWTIPAERMKIGKAHTVPLTEDAIAAIHVMWERRLNEYVFPGQKPGRPLSNMALAKLMQRLKADAFTPHGFRSSFRDWCGDETKFPREVAEAALAHKVGNDVERAYRRSDALRKRRALMQAWAGYLNRAGANVLPLKRA